MGVNMQRSSIMETPAESPTLPATGSVAARPPAHHVPPAVRQAPAPLLLFEQVSKWYGSVLAL